MNGGNLMEPTFLPRTEEQAAPFRHKVIKDTTSADMRYLFRWNGIAGSGRNAQVAGLQCRWQDRYGRQGHQRPLRQ